jgi:hypothetical protein
VPAVIKATVPAVPAILNPEEYLAFEDMVSAAESVEEWWDSLGDVIRRGQRPTAEWLKEARRELEGCDDEDGLEFAADCARQLARFNPKSAYDSKGRITMAQASVHIAALVDGFPTKNAPDNFVDRLLLEVLAAKPSVVELEAACRQILRSAESDFMPGAGKVLAAIREQQRIWPMRTMAINCFARRVERLREAVAAGEAKLAAEEVKREEQRVAAEEKKRVDDELRAQPITVGDRVRNKRSGHMGPGTIAAAFRDGFHVCYDNMGNGYVFDGKDLERLIPGDSGFSIVEAKRAAIEKRLAEYLVLLQRRQRPVVGDRVTDDIGDWIDPEYPSHGAGTVTFAGDFEPGGFDDGFTIRFDSGVLGENFMPDCLRRLLPGDPNFVAGANSPPPDVSMDFPINPAADDDEPPRSYFGGRLQP